MGQYLGWGNLRIKVRSRVRFEQELQFGSESEWNCKLGLGLEIGLALELGGMLKLGLGLRLELELEYLELVFNAQWKKKYLVSFQINLLSKLFHFIILILRMIHFRKFGFISHARCSESIRNLGSYLGRLAILTLKC